MAWLAIAVPVLAAVLGWLILWRRNSVVYSLYNIHFCGDDLFEKEFWAPSKQSRTPLIDTIEIRFRNFGLKHLNQAHFLLHYMSDDSVLHADHGNNIPACNFEFAAESPTVVRVNIIEIPAFEAFSIAILNTHPSRKFKLVGSGSGYKFVTLKDFRRKTISLVVGVFSLLGIVLWIALR